MEVTRVEQRAYIKILVLRGRNEMECHSEFVEALKNNALPNRTVSRWVGKFHKDVCQPVMSNVRDDRSMCGPTWHVPSSRMKTDDRDNKQRRMEKRTTNASSSQLYVYCDFILLHREGHITYPVCCSNKLVCYDISVLFIVHTCS
ncbi:HTH_48 domain-containing protein [Trichonephila clavata]|uniref:HTH_48 domain-containing protein n=1 Tax=Trichonephila clavata TaxID=2740835 RepID=A0A8X6M0Y5_TRICU|nr:HTH_48 domain-containing protein [Trichonephila clavata]